MTEINGVNYQVRERSVNGQKTQIYYKDGEAFIKNAEGKMEKLHKMSDNAFKKAEYWTDGYYKEVQDRYNQRLNEKFSDDNRPTLNGGITDARTLIHSDDIVGFKGKFGTLSGASISGVIIRDLKTNENRVLQSRNAENGTNMKAIYALDEGTGAFFLERKTITNPDGSGIERRYNYETGDYEVTKFPAKPTED